MRRILKRVASVIALLGLLSSTGCVAIKPWERELLARPDMQWEDDSLLGAIKGHTYFSKEATFSSSGGGGGGCGCN